MARSALAGAPRRTIQDIKQEILRRADERQALIERGEYDVPVYYAPLPLSELLDLLGQLEYRRDALGLAVPPPHPALGERLKRALKSAVCKILRWLFIRQVEYNSAAIEVLRQLSDLLGRSDRNQNEFAAALTVVKLQVHALAGRLGELERLAGNDRVIRPESVGYDSNRVTAHRHDRNRIPQIQGVPPGEDRGLAHQAYLPYLRGRDAVLVLGVGLGELVKLLVSEGVAVHGVDGDADRVEYCRERDLPVVLSEPAGYLERSEADSTSAIFVDLSDGPPQPAALAQLLARAWISLRKGGYLIVETPTPMAAENALPVELLSYMIESHCFTVVDLLLSAPLRQNVDPVVQRTSGQTISLKDYRRYAVVGRK
jgi:hypothetical protein